VESNGAVEERLRGHVPRRDKETADRKEVEGGGGVPPKTGEGRRGRQVRVGSELVRERYGKREPVRGRGRRWADPERCRGFGDRQDAGQPGLIKRGER